MFLGVNVPRTEQLEYSPVSRLKTGVLLQFAGSHFLRAAQEGRGRTGSRGTRQTHWTTLRPPVLDCRPPFSSRCLLDTHLKQRKKSVNKIYSTRAFNLKNYQNVPKKLNVLINHKRLSSIRSKMEWNIFF